MATVVKGDQMAPFSIATTPRCRGGHYWIAPLYPWYVPYNAECSARRCQVPFFKPLVWLDLGLNPGLPDYWQTLYPQGQRASLFKKAILENIQLWGNKWLILSRIICIKNKWNHLIVCQKLSTVSFKNVINKICLEIIYLIYMYKNNLA